MFARVCVRQNVPGGRRQMCTKAARPNLASANLSLRLADGVVASKDMFAGKKVVVVSVPGAFTGTCSKQIPQYIANADKFKQKGINDIVVVSVNDGASMNAGNSVKFVADWDGAFTRAMGQEIDLSAAGLGKRSSRYAALVENGEVKKLIVEAKPSDLTTTAAEAILKDLHN